MRPRGHLVRHFGQLPVAVALLFCLLLKSGSWSAGGYLGLSWECFDFGVIYSNPRFSEIYEKILRD